PVPYEADVDRRDVVRVAQRINSEQCAYYVLGVGEQTRRLLSTRHGVSDKRHHLNRDNVRGVSDAPAPSRDTCYVGAVATIFYPEEIRAGDAGTGVGGPSWGTNRLELIVSIGSRIAGFRNDLSRQPAMILVHSGIEHRDGLVRPLESAGPGPRRAYAGKALRERQPQRIVPGNGQRLGRRSELLESGLIDADDDVGQRVVSCERRRRVPQPGKHLILSFLDHLALRQNFDRARHQALGPERGPHLHGHRDGSLLLRFFNQFLEPLIEACAASQLGGGRSLRIDGG